MLTSLEQQRNCLNECPSDCEKTLFKISRDTKLVMPNIECEKSHVMEAALREITVSNLN